MDTIKKYPRQMSVRIHQIPTALIRSPTPPPHLPSKRNIYWCFLTGTIYYFINKQYTEYDGILCIRILQIFSPSICLIYLPQALLGIRRILKWNASVFISLDYNSKLP